MDAKAAVQQDVKLPVCPSQVELTWCTRQCEKIVDMLKMSLVESAHTSFHQSSVSQVHSFSAEPWMEKFMVCLATAVMF
jgi:hypothetical protein